MKNDEKSITLDKLQKLRKLLFYFSFVIIAVAILNLMGKIEIIYLLILTIIYLSFKLYINKLDKKLGIKKKK